jgi:hypothetical protein
MTGGRVTARRQDGKTDARGAQSVQTGLSLLQAEYGDGANR